MYSINVYSIASIAKEKTFAPFLTAQQIKSNKMLKLTVEPMYKTLIVNIFSIANI